MQNNLSEDYTIKNHRILITGGAGFIGSNLCESLLANNEVVCFDNLATGKMQNIEGFITHKNFRFVEGDIRNLADCLKVTDGIDYVLHQAALGSVSRSIKDPITTNEVNINGFLNMLEASKRSKIKRFVFAASSSTYGDSASLPKIEEVIGKPLSPYAVTKYVNELYASVYFNLYGLESIGLRYFNVFGKKQTPDGEYAAVIPKFIDSFLKLKSPEIYGDGSTSRDFTYIKNVIEANQRAITASTSSVNQVYNVAYGESNTLNNLIEIIKDLLANINPDIANIKPIYKDERAGDIKHSLASIAKAKKNLGYNPQYSLKQGLEEAIEWYLKNSAVQVS